MVSEHSFTSSSWICGSIRVVSAEHDYWRHSGLGLDFTRTLTPSLVDNSLFSVVGGRTEVDMGGQVVSTHAHTHTHTHGHTSLSSFTHKPVQVTLFYNFTLLSAQIHAHIIGTVIFRLLGEKHWVSPSCTNVFSLCSHCCLYSHDGGWSETEHISAWRWRSTLFALALQEAWKLLYYWILPSQVLREVEAFSVLFTTLEL